MESLNRERVTAKITENHGGSISLTPGAYWIKDTVCVCGPSTMNHYSEWIRPFRIKKVKVTSGGVTKKKVKRALGAIRRGEYQSNSLYDVKALIETAIKCIEHQADKFEDVDRNVTLSLLENAKAHVVQASKERRQVWDQLIAEAKESKPVKTSEQLVKEQNREAARAHLRVKILSERKSSKTYSAVPDYNGGL